MGHNTILHPTETQKVLSSKIAQFDFYFELNPKNSTKLIYTSNFLFISAYYFFTDAKLGANNPDKN